MSTQKKGKRTGGRRANYAPAPHEVGIRKRLPVGWAHWLGFVLFGLLTLSTTIAIVLKTSEGIYADAVAALIMTGLLGFVTWLFATVRFEED
jgi:hypothetical protein